MSGAQRPGERKMADSKVSYEYMEGGKPEKKVLCICRKVRRGNCHCFDDPPSFERSRSLPVRSRGRSRSPKPKAVAKRTHSVTRRMQPELKDTQRRNAYNDHGLVPDDFHFVQGPSYLEVWAKYEDYYGNAEFEQMKWSLPLDYKEKVFQSEAELIKRMRELDVAWEQESD